MNFWHDPAFAELNRVSAEMDREMNAMLRSAQAEQAQIRQDLYNVSFGQVSPGTVEYSQVSTWTHNGVCTRTMRVSEPSSGGKPQMVSDTSGNCAAAHASHPVGVAIPAKATVTPHEAPATRAL